MLGKYSCVCTWFREANCKESSMYHIQTSFHPSKQAFEKNGRMVPYKLLIIYKIKRSIWKICFSINNFLKKLIDMKEKGTFGKIQEKAFRNSSKLHYNENQKYKNLYIFLGNMCFSLWLYSWREKDSFILTPNYLIYWYWCGEKKVRKQIFRI